MRAPAFLLSLLCLFAFSGEAGARHDKPMANLDIRQMASMEGRRTVWRALVGVERGHPYLVVELLRRGRGRGRGDRLMRQHRFDHVSIGRSRLSLDNFDELSDLRWSRRSLRFTASGHKGDLTCRLHIRRRRIHDPTCVGTNQAHEPTPEPPPSSGGENWASHPEMIRACGDVFSGSRNERACLQALGGARQNPKPILEACDEAMGGDQNELACLRAAVDGRGDVARAIGQCEAAMGGDRNELTCVKLVAGDRRARGVISACEEAMSGDKNELRCIRAAREIRRRPAEVVSACEEGASGDSDELACIKSAAGRRGRGGHDHRDHRRGQRRY